MNGAARGAGAAPESLTSASVSAYIGNRPAGDRSFAGAMDEVRISNYVRSADWIATEYNNQYSPSTFYAVGTEETGGTPCSYSLSPTQNTVVYGGASASVAVTAGGSCSWTATSNVGWITITSGASGTGNGTVGYSVEANTGGARNGTLTIGGQTFTLNQTAEQVSTPNRPSGPTSLRRNVAGTYSAGGASSSSGHPVQYQFYWGDGTNSGWLPVGTTTASHSWPRSSYSVTVRARCATDTAVVSAASAALTVNVTN